MVIPALADTTTKVREDYLPAATQASARMVSEATKRSAPYRAELASRGMTTLAAVRGQITAEDLAGIQAHGKRRKMKFLGAAALISAATGAGVLLWQRTHVKPWIDDTEPVQTGLTNLKSENKTDNSPQQSTPKVSVSDDDPAAADGATETSAQGRTKGSTNLHSHH